MKDKNVLAVLKPPTDHPFKTVCEAVRLHAEKGRLCYQKFSCSKCGQRLTMETPNVFHKTGSCDQCGHITDIEKQGCNYLLEIHNATLEEALNAGKEAGDG
jgi:PHP family Zn ribbon phosphoesterase